MDPVLRALLLSWDWRVEVILTLAVAGVVYSRGWRRLRRGGRRPRQQPRQKRLATADWRLAAYLSGLATLGLALMSPIDVLGGQLFFIHMIQHLLLVMIAPPLLLLANPLPFFMWGLPAGGRGEVGRWLAPGSAFRRGLRSVTSPGLVWMGFVAFFLGWHDPNAYNAALQSELVHDLEHITFFGAAMLFWWHVVGAGPRLRFLSRGIRLAFVLATVPVNMLTGIFIAFADQPIYTYYTTVPRPWGITVMQDQMLGGAIMWIPGSMMYLLAALILISRMIQTEADKQPLPESERTADETLIAPG